jgi:dinuclear metal center YbgI/SA1388 family protein
MAVLADLVVHLERIAPLRLAADWDSVGLLVAPRRESIGRLMTCLSLTPAVAAEAVRERADLVVTHHPLPFRPVGRITPDSGPGRVLLELIHAGCGIWSSHTAWDSAAGGVNDQLAAMLGLEHVAPIEPDAELPLAGFGRAGSAPRGLTVGGLARLAGGRLAATTVQIVGDQARPAGRVGVVCGSGGDAIAQVRRGGCDTLLTGELRLHHALEAEAAGLTVVAVGHHASERFSLSSLAARIAEAFPGLACWASADDRDPFAPLA